MINEKLKANLNSIKKQQEAPQTIRGVDVASLTTEKITQRLQKLENVKFMLHKGYHLFLAVYLLFFSFLFKLIAPFAPLLKEMGIFIQMIFILFAAAGINRLLSLIPQYIPETKNQNILSMLQIYAFICLIITFLSLNNLSFDIFKLAE